MREGGRAETATVLFTDLVGSTQMRTTLGDDRADTVRREHDRLLQEVVHAHGGTRVKGVGDGLMAVFPAAAEAVTAAVAMQRAIDRFVRRSADHALAMRVGLSAGDVSWEGDDCFGTPVVEAKRLCDAADGGQILLGEVVRLLSGSRGGHEYAAVGSLELKGLGQPVPAYAVSWRERAAAVPLPPELAQPEGISFIGRAEQRGALSRAWKEALGGFRRVVLLSGEPGVGKTRIAAETARTAHAEGATVMFGRCDSDLGVPHQPFVEALRRFSSACPDVELRDTLGPLAGELARLVPELADLVPGLPEPLKADPETERMRLFDAVAAWLSSSAELAPVILLLDDIHWADKPTLLMLRHVARVLAEARLLVIGTYRDTDLGRGHPLADVLADLRRERGVDRVDLQGLDEGEVAAFMEAAAGHAMDDEGLVLARRIWEETEGNPFFVGQVLRHLSESGAIVERDGRWVPVGGMDHIGIPQGIREVIGRRLTALPERTVEILGVASVIGREFDDRLLREACDADAEEVLDALEQGEEARVVEAVPGTTGRHGFVHALVRSTLYDEMPTTRRLRLHRRIGLTLEGRGDDSAPQLAALAHHFCEAAGLGETRRAVDYSIRAAEAAYGRAAYEEAATIYQRALTCLDPDDPDTLPDAARLFAGLAGARLSSGDRQHAIAASEQGVAYARRARRPDLLATAAMARNAGWAIFEAGVIDEDLVRHVEEALDAMPADDSPVRAHATVTLATALYFAADASERRRALIEEGLAMARRLDNPDVLASVLVGTQVALWSRDNVEELLAYSSELVALAREVDDPFVEAHGLGFLLLRVWESGRVQELDEPMQRLQEVAARLRTPTLTWQTLIWRGAGELFAGRLDEAQTLAQEAFAVSQSIGLESGVQFYGIQEMAIRRLRGGIEEMIPLCASMVEQYPLIPAWRTGLAYVLAESGRLDEAREQLEIMTSGEFELPDDANWLVGMAVLAFACHAVDDSERARGIYDALLPYADRAITVGLPVDCVGSASRYLALLAATMRDWDAWERHVRDAEQAHRAMGAVTWLAVCKYEEAQALLRRGRDGDTGRARTLLEECIAEATAGGWTRTANLARAVLAEF